MKGKKFLEIVVSTFCSALFSSIIGIFEYLLFKSFNNQFKFDSTEFQFFLVLVSLGLLFITIFFFLIFKKSAKKPRRKIIWMILIIGLILCIIPPVKEYFFKEKPEPFTDKQFGILVADFGDKNLTTNGESLQDTYLSELNDDYECEIENEKVAIKGWPGSIQEEDGSLETVGRKQKADILIYGVTTIRPGKKPMLSAWFAIENKYLKPEVKETSTHLRDHDYTTYKIPPIFKNNLKVLYPLSNVFIKMEEADFDSAERIVNNLPGQIGDTLKHHFLGIVYLNRASRDQELKRNREKADSLLSKAKSEFKNSIKLDPNYHNSYCSLGTLYIQQRNADSARICFEKACNLKPTNLKYIFALNKIYSDNGYYREQVQFLNTLKKQKKFYESLPSKTRNELEKSLIEAQKVIKY